MAAANESDLSFRSGMQKLDKYGWNTVAKQIFMGLFTAVLFFMAAGTLEWGWGWVMNILNIAGWTGLSLVLIRENPELLNVRGNTRKAVGTEVWDWVILLIYSLLIVVIPVVAALDFRYGWVEPMPDVFRYLGVIMMIDGFFLMTWSMAVNRHFEPMVRIQEDRNHHVVTSGPYRYIRHPGYTAVILTVLPLAWIPASWVATVPALILVIAFVIRTALEDRTLRESLEGYEDYTHHTPYRLIPYVW